MIVVGAGLPAGAAPAVSVGESAPPPPSCNTGVELTNSVHWLRGVNRELPLDFHLEYLSDLLGGPEVFDRGLYGYSRTYLFPLGVKLLENEQRPDMGVCVDIDGDACDALGFAKVQTLYWSLQLRASRLDTATDGCDFTPADLHREWSADNVRTRCKPLDPTKYDIKPGREDIRRSKWITHPTGDTFYMGSRTSSVHARCYDRRGPTRFELELKDERADKVAQLLFAENAPVPEIITGIITDFVDFVDKNADKNRSRCPKLPFWEKFIAGLERLKIDLDPRPLPSLGRLRDWIEQQVAPALALYEMAFGSRDSYDDVRRSLRKMGLERLKPKHRALLVASGAW